MTSKDTYTRKKKRGKWIKNEYENNDFENKQSKKFSRLIQLIITEI